MKKSLLSILVMLFAVVATSYADDIYGTYKGTINVLVSGNPMPSATDKNAILEKKADGTVTLSIKQFKFLQFDFGDKIVVPGLEAEEDGTSLTIFPNETPVDVDLGEPLNHIDVTVDEGNVVDKVLSLKLTIITSVPAEGTIVEVTYKGTKVEGVAISSTLSQNLNIHADANQIIVSGVEAGTAYQVYDLAGNAVKTGVMTNGTIAASHLVKGIYIVKLNTEAGMVARKVVKP